jgi:hypothetical protein
MTSGATQTPEPIVTRCARHPDVETELRCGRCETLICPRCLVFTPGGTRCPDCAMLRRPVMYELQPVHYVRAAGTALAVSFGLAVAGLLLLPLVRGVPFLGLMLAIALGAGAGSVMAAAVTWATNGKRGLAMQAIAGIGLLAAWALPFVLLPVLLNGAITPQALLGALAAAPRDLLGLLAAVVAVVVASQRLR